MVDNPGPVIEFRVKNGKVKMAIPKKVLCESEDVDFRGFDNEIGCSVEKVREIIELILNKK